MSFDVCKASINVLWYNMEPVIPSTYYVVVIHFLDNYEIISLHTS